MDAIILDQDASSQLSPGTVCDTTHANLDQVSSPGIVDEI